jgi:hypothetical protein
MSMMARIRCDIDGAEKEAAQMYYCPRCEAWYCDKHAPKDWWSGKRYCPRKKEVNNMPIHSRFFRVLQFLLMLMCLVNANGQTLRASGVWSANGHLYEVWQASAIDWDTARAFAARQSRPGYGYGYLACITSAEENGFIANLVVSNIGIGGEYWLGGFQPPGETRPDANWNWVSGEPFIYTNWYPGEPNDFFGPASEQHLAIDLRRGNPQGRLWNDESNLGNISGFIIEYGQVGQAGDANGDGCVDDADLLQVLFAFGQTGTNLPEDVNCDGTVDDADLLLVLFNFGSGC